MYFVSFVPQFNAGKTFLKLNQKFPDESEFQRKVERLNVILSDKRKSLDKRDCLLYFASDHQDEKVIVFNRNTSEVVRDQVFLLFFLFFTLEILSQKSRSSLSPSCTLKYILQENHSYGLNYLHTRQSGLILVTYPFKQISIHKPNAKIIKFCTLNSYEK